MGLNLESTEVYDPNECVVFFKTKEAYGGLSNMCGGVPLLVDGHFYRTSGALYQTLEFPDQPPIQKMIQHEPSPLFAKKKTSPYKHLIRADWEDVKVALIRRCLARKPEQHPEDFADLLRSTASRPIVEKTRKDRFWGGEKGGRDARRAEYLGEVIERAEGTGEVDKYIASRCSAPAYSEFFMEPGRKR